MGGWSPQLGAGGGVGVAPSTRAVPSPRGKWFHVKLLSVCCYSATARRSPVQRLRASQRREQRRVPAVPVVGAGGEALLLPLGASLRCAPGRALLAPLPEPLRVSAHSGDGPWRSPLPTPTCHT